MSACGVRLDLPTLHQHSTFDSCEHWLVICLFFLLQATILTSCLLKMNPILLSS